MAQVRVATVADAEAVAAIYAPYVLETAISFEEEPPSVLEMASRISATLKTYPFLVFEDDCEVIGYAYAAAPARARNCTWMRPKVLKNHSRRCTPGKTGARTDATRVAHG